METEENVKFVRFTITEDEVREVAEGVGIYNLSDGQVRRILNVVECDEMLAKDINSSIISAIHYCKEFRLREFIQKLQEIEAEKGGDMLVTMADNIAVVDPVFLDTPGGGQVIITDQD